MVTSKYQSVRLEARSRGAEKKKRDWPWTLAVLGAFLHTENLLEPQSGSQKQEDVPALRLRAVRPLESEPNQTSMGSNTAQH